MQAGFEALYFGRIDYQDREKRIAESDMEMLWRPSRSLEDKAQIFTGEGGKWKDKKGKTPKLLSRKSCDIFVMVKVLSHGVRRQMESYDGSGGT